MQVYLSGIVFYTFKGGTGCCAAYSVSPRFPVCLGCSGVLQKCLFYAQIIYYMKYGHEPYSGWEGPKSPPPPSTNVEISPKNFLNFNLFDRLV